MVTELPTKQVCSAILATQPSRLLRKFGQAANNPVILRFFAQKDKLDVCGARTWMPGAISLREPDRQADNQNLAKPSFGCRSRVSRTKVR